MARTQFAQLKLNVPPELRDRLRAAAADNNRSLNSEIINRLSSEVDAEMPADEPRRGKGATLTVRLSDEMRVKLDSLTVRGPYRISITSIVERGIELAAAELEGLSERAKAGEP